MSRKLQLRITQRDPGSEDTVVYTIPLVEKPGRIAVIRKDDCFLRGEDVDRLSKVLGPDALLLVLTHDQDFEVWEVE